jgi:hypothetical protein
MFANAIMFNPTPERGFGPSFPLQRDSEWRNQEQHADSEDVDAGEGAEPVVLNTASARYQRLGVVDDGGVVNDTREMFEDVERVVREWRVAEKGTLIPAMGLIWEEIGSVKSSVSKVRESLGEEMEVENENEEVNDNEGVDDVDELAGRESESIVGRAGDDESGTVAGKKRRRGGE